LGAIFGIFLQRWCIISIFFKCYKSEIFHVILNTLLWYTSGYACAESLTQTLIFPSRCLLSLHTWLQRFADRDAPRIKENYRKVLFTPHPSSPSGHQLNHADVRRLIERPPTTTPHCHRGVIFGGQKLWVCLSHSNLCRPVTRPGRVVPETRDPLKPDDNMRKGGGCIRGRYRHHIIT